MEEVVEDIGRLVRRRGYNGDMIRCVLVGDVGIEAETGIDAVLDVDIAYSHTLAAPEELAVRTRCGARLPGRGDRQRGMCIDQDGERAMITVLPVIEGA